MSNGPSGAVRWRCPAAPPCWTSAHAGIDQNGGPCIARSVVRRQLGIVERVANHPLGCRHASGAAGGAAPGGPIAIRPGRAGFLVRRRLEYGDVLKVLA